METKIRVFVRPQRYGLGCPCNRVDMVPRIQDVIINRTFNRLASDRVLTFPVRPQCRGVLVQAGGPIGRLYEIEIELPDFTTRSYSRSTSRKRSKKSRKVVSKTTSSSKSPNRQPGVNQVVKTIEMKPKRARGKSAPRQPKP